MLLSPLLPSIGDFVVRLSGRTPVGLTSHPSHTLAFMGKTGILKSVYPGVRAGQNPGPGEQRVVERLTAGLMAMVKIGGTSYQSDGWEKG